MKAQVQHEFDHEPTYIVDEDTDQDLVTLDPCLPYEIRRKLARAIADGLNKKQPTLLTKEQLDAMVNSLDGQD